MKKADEQNLAIVYYHPGQKPEVTVFPYPLPKDKPDRSSSEEFGGLTTVDSLAFGETSSWVFQTKHRGAIVRMEIPIGQARDPVIGTHLGLIGVFDRTINQHLQNMVEACIEFKASFDKDIMHKK
ncbi:MAG TPA: hypothetical protein VMQ44_00440 [Candidatus Saccharimonadales bacterium]|nr:hypothetical protein [Candidatus Saccharimonadales bacterium]